MPKSKMKTILPTRPQVFRCSSISVIRIFQESIRSSVQSPDNAGRPKADSSSNNACHDRCRLGNVSIIFYHLDDMIHVHEHACTVTSCYVSIHHTLFKSRFEHFAHRTRRETALSVGFVAMECAFKCKNLYQLSHQVKWYDIIFILHTSYIVQEACLDSRASSSMSHSNPKKKLRPRLITTSTWVRMATGKLKTRRIIGDSQRVFCAVYWCLSSFSSLSLLQTWLVLWQQLHEKLPISNPR